MTTSIDHTSCAQVQFTRRCGIRGKGYPDLSSAQKKCMLKALSGLELVERSFRHAMRHHKLACYPKLASRG